MLADVLPTALEAGVNAWFSLDPEAKTKLASFEGKLLCVRIEGFEKNLYFNFTAEKIRVQKETDRAPDTSIYGPPLALLRLSTSKDIKRLFEGAVRIEGDAEFAKEVKRLFDYIDVDWEEHLSKPIGDLPAHKVSHLFGNFQSWLARGRNSMYQDSNEYLHEEAKLLLHPNDAQHFYVDVDNTRDHLERLAARIKRIERKLSC